MNILWNPHFIYICIYKAYWRLAMPICVHIICGCFHVTRAELIVETETLRPTEPKMCILCPLPEGSLLIPGFELFYIPFQPELTQSLQNFLFLRMAPPTRFWMFCSVSITHRNWTVSTVTAPSCPSHLGVIKICTQSLSPDWIIWCPVSLRDLWLPTLIQQ